VTKTHLPTHGVIPMLILTALGLSCDRPAHAADLPLPKTDLPTTLPSDKTPRTAVLAGGCFWCTEVSFKQLAGVKAVVSGYAGGTKETADYETVCTGTTGHAEAIKITYDPSKITYGQLLRVFFTIHDPTTKDAQGPDHGHQYRSAIFYQSPDEKRVAEAYIQQLNESHAFAKPIVTTLEPYTGFYPAEAYHQDYVTHHPDNPYIQQFALPKLRKVREKFKDQVKPESNPGSSREQ